MDWLLPRLTDTEKEALEQCMTLFAQPNPDGATLRKQATQIAELEKRFVTLNPDQQPNPQLQGRTLVCTVGMRPLPVLLSILLLQPTRLYLFHTNESRRFAEQIRDDIYVQELGLDPVLDIVLRTISLVDAPQNYEQMQRVIRENPEHEFVVDISGGVKVMGVSLAAAAFWLRIPVVYQLGEEIAGAIRPFSEKLTELENPYEFFGSTDLRGIEDMFQAGDYDAALSICNNLRETVGDTQTLGKLNILEEFIAVYRDWDAFAHSRSEDDEIRKLATRLRVVIGKMKRLRIMFADEEKLQNNLRFLNELESTWKDVRNNAELNRLVDIYAASLRRGKAGKYDDAVARLYRCVEMSATICLINDCQLGNVDKSPNFTYFIVLYGSESKLAENFKKNARYDLDPKRLTLNTQIVLLGLSQERRHKHIWDLYQGFSKGNLMEYRNRSTLAHGTVPVSQSEYEKFDNQTRRIIAEVFQERETLELLLDYAQHPKITVQF